MEESDIDYHIDEDLEEIFHSDLQNIELGDDGNHNDIIGDHLPEWLVGVIVVIAMLIVAFFVMIITSLIKNRKKSRSSTYIGAGSSTACDDLESGKIGHSDESGMKITSFTSVPDSSNDRSMLSQLTEDSSDNDLLTTRGVNDVTGVQGCKNPLFVDDDLESDETNEGKDSQDRAKTSSKCHDINMPSTSNDINMPSTSNGIIGNDPTESGRSKGVQHKYKQSCNAKRNSIKSEANENDKSSEHENDARKRIFSTKSKCGNQTSNKRDKNKGLSSNDSFISSDGEKKKSSNDIKEVAKEDNMEDQKTKISGDLHLKDNDTSTCCEDSGVELGSTDSQLKDEAGGSSESDEIVSMVTRASYEACIKAGSDHSPDTVRSDDAKYLHVSPSMTLNSEDDSPSSCGTEKSGFCHTPGSQSSSLGCSLENLTLGTPGGKTDADLRLLESVSRSVEMLQLQNEVQETSLSSGEPAAQKEINLNPVLLATSCPGVGEGTISCDPSCSNIKRTNEAVTPMLADKSMLNIASSAGNYGPRSCQSVPAVQTLNTHECDNNIDPDKLLSTNL